MVLDWNLSLAFCKTCVVAAVITAPSPVEPPGGFIPNEALYLPLLRSEIVSYWPTAPLRSVFAAQVQQETCASLRSKKCWSPTTELKTDREYGFGLGQITVTAKFDNFKEAKKLHPSMKDWTWENRYNPTFQLRTLVLMDQFNYEKFGWAKDDFQRMSFAFAAYNCGIGGVLSDRAVCRATSGCDGTVWFENVERTSKKAKVAAKGYGKSFFEINREYVRNVMESRRTRYRGFFGE